MSTEVCPYYNVGYCKQKDNCSKSHPSVECETKCKIKTCLKRHKKPCKDKDLCKFLKSNSCEFKHEVSEAIPTSEPPKIILDLKNLVEALLKENKVLNEQMQEKDTKINKLTEDLVNLFNRVDKLENLKTKKVKCDMCDFEAKNETGLGTHKSRIHKKENIRDLTFDNVAKPVEESISNDPAKDKVEQYESRGEIETNVVSIHKYGDQEIQLADVMITYPRECDLCKFRAKTLKVFTSHMVKAHKTS